MAPRQKTDFIDVYELLLVLLIAAGAWGALLPTTSLMMFKARFSGVFVNLLPHQLESVEQFALTGSWLESEAEVGQTEPRTEREVSDLENELRAPVRKRPAAAKPGEGRLTGSSEHLVQGPGASSRYGIVDGSIVVVGRMQGYARPFQLAIRPAVREGDEPATIIWLCGDRGVPPGWIAAGPQVPASLPRAYLYSQCRKDPHP